VAGQFLVLALRGRGAAKRTANSDEEVNVAWYASTLPGRRTVTSRKIQPFPSGSQNEVKEP
jgi:hypothetical protein